MRIDSDEKKPHPPEAGSDDLVPRVIGVPNQLLPLPVLNVLNAGADRGE